MIRGRHVGLRAIEPGDLEPLRGWRNRPAFRRYFRETGEISKDKQLQWYERIVLADPNTIMFAIERVETGELIGACGLCYINRIDRSADFSIYIGADDLYIDDALAPDAARLLMAYGFEEQNLHRLWAEIYAFDAPKAAMFPALGFTLEGRMREAHWTEGAWTDCLYFARLSTD
ncbi:MAG: GNAT family protein [Pseudomonadota bacterium]